MTECSGNVCFCTSETVTGRLLRLENALGATKRYATLLIWDGTAEPSDAALDGAVGLIICNCPDDTARKHARHTAELCRLPSMEINAPLPENTVAILDTYHNKLYINPDLETIGAYLTPPNKERLRKVALTQDGDCSPLPYGFEGVTVGADIPKDADEQQVYEYLCEVSDRYVGLSISALADVSTGEQAFKARLRAIYRAGVWGRFSLVCINVSTPEKARYCVRAMHEAFHSLDKERREFDGFMPKGIVIDTPIMLLSVAERRMIDFFCLDIKRLLGLFCGKDATDESETHIIPFIKEFMSRSSPCGIILKNAEGLSDRSILTLLETGHVREICVKSSEKERFATLL